MNGHHQVALWAGIAGFFSSLLAIGVIEVFNPDDLIKFATSLIVAVVTASAVYSKQRLEDAKRGNGSK